MGLVWVDIRYKNNIDGLVEGEYGNLKDGIYMRIMAIPRFKFGSYW